MNLCQRWFKDLLSKIYKVATMKPIELLWKNQPTEKARREQENL